VNFIHLILRTALQQNGITCNLPRLAVQRVGITENQTFTARRDGTIVKKV